MGKINVILSDDLEKRLRLRSLELKGGRKGDLSKSVGDAIEVWLTATAN